MSGMKVGGGSASLLSGKAGKSAPGPDLSGKGKQDIGPNGPRDSQSSGSESLSGKVLNFGTKALNKTGDTNDKLNMSSQQQNALSDEPTTGQHEAGAQSGNSIMSSIAQLLGAIVQLLKGQAGQGDKAGHHPAAKTPFSAGQSEKGSDDLFTQLMKKIKEMLGMSTDDTKSGEKTAGEESSPVAAHSHSHAHGNAGKLGAALQLLGLGALLSAIQGGSGSAQSNESAK